METKKILIYGKDGFTKLVINGKVSDGESYFKEAKNSTVPNCLYNLARVLYSIAEKEDDQKYEIMVISNVWYTVMTDRLKKELWTGKTSYEKDGKNIEIQLGEAELEVRTHVAQAMQLAYMNVNLVNMRDIPEESEWKPLIDMVKPANKLETVSSESKLTAVEL